ncbi:uncharacterized protein LOC142348782 [Convolutriloba macropyga]|uniref:uncharacterized protein LOC142348782 n=1 Tax=Convolutriloba macropyga TaxID=536237 RepID=UPI003F52172B
MLTQLAIIAFCAVFINADYIVDRRYDPFMLYKRQGIRYNMNSKEGDDCEEAKDCDKYKQLYCSMIGECVFDDRVDIPSGCDQNERCPSGQLCDVYRKNCFTPSARRGQEFESRQILF